MKIEMRDPADLRLHGVRKRLALAEPVEAEWNAFVDGLSGAGAGGIPPIFVTPDGQVMDGKRRHQAARQLGWKEIACVVRPEEDCGVLMVESLMGQRNLQRCVKVYIAISILKDFASSSEQRRLRNLKNGLKTLEKPLTSNLSPKTIEDSTRSLGERFGVSRETVRRAVQVCAVFEKYPEIKGEWEPKLLSGDKNLWNVLSAVGGAGADQGRRASGVDQAQLEFWNNPWSGLKAAAPAWMKLDEERREAVIESFKQAARKLPQDLRDGMAEALEDLSSERNHRAAA